MAYSLPIVTGNLKVVSEKLYIYTNILICLFEFVTLRITVSASMKSIYNLTLLWMNSFLILHRLSLFRLRNANGSPLPPAFDRILQVFHIITQNFSMDFVVGIVA